jgi:hypothetical protein
MRFVKPEENDCPFCGQNLVIAALEYRMKMEEAMRVAERLAKLLAPQAE